MANRGENVSLDVLYAPSYWSTRLSSDVIVDKHIEVLHEATLRARDQLRCELNIQYDPESGQLLDVYYPSQAAAAAAEQGALDVVVYIHGGYWQQLSKNESGFMAPFLAKRGYITVSLGYDIAPKGTMTTIVDQCRKGCAFVKNRFPNSRMFVAGHSAGGHLSACMLTTDWSKYGVHAPHPLTGAVLLSGVFDLKEIRSTFVNKPLNLTDEEVELYSPQYHIGEVPKELKVLVAWGEEDSPPFKSQGDNYHKSLMERGVDSTVHVVQEDHFSVLERLSKEDPTYSLQEAITDFLKA